MEKDKRIVGASKMLTPSEIATALVAWFKKKARALPWREEYNPYHVYISEIMLQQTQMETVLPYFLRWIDRYPDLSYLVVAEEEEALKLWEGLGYYSRCRNVLACAGAMVADGYSTPPSDPNILITYPGIGPYTAGAIASIAYDLPFPAIDGNVERVCARLFDCAHLLGSKDLKSAVRLMVERLLETVSPRLLNQGMMELGALVCLPSTPRCLECPLQEGCVSLREGLVRERPVPKPRPKIENISAVGIVLMGEERVLLRKRAQGGLWGGFWEVPWLVSEKETISQIQKWVSEQLGVVCAPQLQKRVVRFSFTKHRVVASVALARLPEHFEFAPQALPEGWAFFSKETLGSVTLSSGSRKFLKGILL